MMKQSDGRPIASVRVLDNRPLKSRRGSVGRSRGRALLWVGLALVLWWVVVLALIAR